LRNFLALAVKNREVHALEESIAQATKLHLSERDAPELTEARRLLEDLRAHPHLAGAGYGGGSGGGSGGLVGGHGGGGDADKQLSKEHRERERALKAERKDKERAEKDAQKERARAEKEKEKADKERQHAEDHAGDGKSKDKLKWFGAGGFGSGGKSKDKDKAAASSAAAAASSASSAAPKLFGGPLHEAMVRNPSGSGIPRVVECCTRYLRATALQEPGLFRVAGNKDAIDVLRAAFEEDYAHATTPTAAAAAAGSDSGASAAAVRDPPPLTEVHDASGLLKLYFRLLPEPLIPFDSYAAFIKAGMNKGEGRVQQLAALVAALPLDNRTMLRFLFFFLADVVAHSSVNKMSAENCAIVFAPNLIRPKVETPASMMTDMPSSISVIASFAAHAHDIFPQPDAHASGNGAAAAAAASSI
jgi:hypothetical protein